MYTKDNINILDITQYEVSEIIETLTALIENKKSYFLKSSNSFAEIEANKLSLILQFIRKLEALVEHLSKHRDIQNFILESIITRHSRALNPMLFESLEDWKKEINSFSIYFNKA